MKEKNSFKNNAGRDVALYTEGSGGLAGRKQHSAFRRHPQKKIPTYKNEGTRGDEGKESVNMSK